MTPAVRAHDPRSFPHGPASSVPLTQVKNYYNANQLSESVFRCSSHPDTGQGGGGFGFLSYKIWVLGGFKL